MEADKVWIDEAGEVTQETWDSLRQVEFRECKPIYIRENCPTCNDYDRVIESWRNGYFKCKRCDIEFRLINDHSNEGEDTNAKEN